MSALLALSYLAAGWLGLLVASKPGNVSALWPPSGIALAALLVWGPDVWIGVWAGSFVTNLIFFPPAGSTATTLLGAALIASGSTLSTRTAALLIARFAGGRAALSGPRHVGAFAASVAFSCAIAATVGLGSTVVLGGLPASAAPRFWLTWWLGDAMGMLAVAPLVLTAGAPPPRGTARDWTGSLVLALGASQVVFGRPLPISDGLEIPVAWAVLPAVVWAAMRLGGPGVAVHTLLLHALVSWATVTGRGPFSLVGAEAALLLIDGLLVTVVLTGLLTASTRAQADVHRVALEAERRLLEQNVRERTAKLEEANLALAAEAHARAELGERLIAAQKEEALGRLAGGVAHDFNNLLTVMSGEAQMIALEPDASPRVLDSTQAILAASQRAAELTRQLLAVARRHPVELRHVDVGRALLEARRLVRPILPENVTLDVDAVGGTARIDPAQLDQVILNLCINARDAMPRGGRLQVSQSLRELDAREGARLGVGAGRWILVTVTDTGEGMAPEVQRRIFEPFFTTKASGRGTGLGLSTALGIASQAGGTLRVQSELGRGTIFSLWIPLEDGPATEQETTPAPPSAPRSAGGATILVAEDEPLVRRLVASTLQRSGHRVLLASDGEEALALARQHSGAIDLLLTDVVMPRGGGPELARALRGTRPLRVLFMSGYHEQQDELAGEHLLPKPFTVAQLNAAVADALARQVDDAAGP